MRRPITADALRGHVVASKYRITSAVESLEGTSLEGAWRAEAATLGTSDFGARVWLWIGEAAGLDHLRQAAAVVHGWQHINTARLIDWGNDAALGRFWVYEAHEGVWLSELLAASAPLPWRRALDLTAQILRALWHAHEHQLFAPLLSPGCIHVIPGGGIGLDAHRDALRVLGLGWLPSEDPRADQSRDLLRAGVLLFEMLTGHPPFVTSDGRALWPPPREASSAPSALPTIERPDAPRALEAFVHALLALDAETRPASARTALDLMDAISEGRPFRALTDHKVMSTARNVEVPPDVQDAPAATLALDPDALPSLLASPEVQGAPPTAAAVSSPPLAAPASKAMNWLLWCAAAAALIAVSMALFFAFRAR